MYMICGESVRVYALEKESFLDSEAIFHKEAFRKCPNGDSRNTSAAQDAEMRKCITSIDLLHPFIHFLQAESSFIVAIVLIWVDMEDLFIGAGQSSSKARSVRLDRDFAAR